MFQLKEFSDSFLEQLKTISARIWKGELMAQKG